MKKLLQVKHLSQNPFFSSTENGVLYSDETFYEWYFGEVTMGTMTDGTGCYILSNPFGCIKIKSDEVVNEIEINDDFQEVLPQLIDQSKVWVI